MSDEETPAWRHLVPGLLFLGFAVYLLVTGTVGVLALRKAWQRIRGP